MEREDEELKVKFEALLEKHKDIFSETLSPDRRIHCEPVELDLDPTVKPTRVTRVKPVPINMQEAVDKCVEDLVEQGILNGPHTETRKWLHAAKFVVKADGVNVRMTVDMVAMNKVI